MDRFRLFHQITTTADLKSMQSILQVALDAVVEQFNAVTGAYFSTSRGLRCLLARGQNRTNIREADFKYSSDVLKRTSTTGQSYQQEVGKVDFNPRATGAFAMGKRALVVPALADNQVIGIAYLERPIFSRSFSNEEITVLGAVFSDVQALLNSSGDYQKASYELDTIKAQAAMMKVNLISNHPAMVKMFGLIRKLAKVPSNVLIQGESGTGKELVAHAIYELGQYDGPFISMNCGGIEANLMKSELFGHARGSFTGAQKDRTGLFKKAENGILFMDEIGEMPMDMQIALLRTLQSGEILPVGTDHPLRVNTRVVAATHRDLAQMVDKGTFRNDLFQRLKGLTLRVPPLRERASDIPLLCTHFVKKYNKRLDQNFSGLDQEALELLKNLAFRDGNVRELEHLIERAMVFEDNEDTITTRYLLVNTSSNVKDEPEPLAGGTYEEQINRFGAKLIQTTLAASNGNKTKTMKKLGLSRSSFYSLLNRFGLS